MVMACQKSEPAPNGDDDKPARPRPIGTDASTWMTLHAPNHRLNADCMHRSATSLRVSVLRRADGA